jgi:hypothetical protein
VIVDWFSGSEGHYSVATRADDERVTVLDVESGEERHFAPDEFVRVWFDFDGDTEKHDGLRSGVMIVVTPKPEPLEAERRLMAAAAGEQEAAEAAEGASLTVEQSVLGRSGEVFVRKPFAEAVAEFASRRVLTKRAFERLVGANKKRAFTIANLGKRAMVEVAHSELTGAIREGIDLRAFRANLAERFTTAGWTPMNPSHVELVFRNATMSAHANGRDVQMTQPHVLKERPYWQALGVDDGDTRPTHKAAHGKVLPASDSFWEKGPIWGHNCRCRKVSRSEADLERLGLSVSSGEEAWAQALPDEGWNE